MSYLALSWRGNPEYFRPHSSLIDRTCLFAIEVGAGNQQPTFQLFTGSV